MTTMNFLRKMSSSWSAKADHPALCGDVLDHPLSLVMTTGGDL
jgi:hypothetical protein